VTRESTEEGALTCRLVLYGEDLGLFLNVALAQQCAHNEASEPLKWERDGDRYEAWSH
jgi:hypothetical protein